MGSLGGNWVLACNWAQEKFCQFRWIAAREGLRFQIWWDFFGLKGTLVQLTTVSEASSCDTEGPWRVWAKTDYWFPIQLRLMKNFHLDCFALYLCIVFHRINLSTTYFSARPRIPSQVMPCIMLHYTLYSCSRYPALSLAYLFFTHLLY